MGTEVTPAPFPSPQGSPLAIAAASPIGASLPGSVLPSPSTPSTVSPRCHPHLGSSKWVLVWGVSVEGVGRSAWGVSLGRFALFFVFLCISYCPFSLCTK